MKADISSVVRTAGAELEINEAGIIDDLKDVYGTIRVTRPVEFHGVLKNMNGLLQLKGKAICTYETQCDYCTGSITRTISVDILEDLAEEDPENESAPDDDQFTYQGSWLLLDKILSDNIALALPMRHRCKKDCGIICPKCGEPVTGNGCGCGKDQPIDPRLAALKNFTEQKHAGKAD